MTQGIFVTMIVATISTAAAADTLPGLVTGSLNPVMAVGHNATAGNMTGTEDMTTAGEIGFVYNPSVRP